MKLGNKNATVDGVLEHFPILDPLPIITLKCTEFTCRCPVTKQPDWAEITYVYEPCGRVVESKSLKMYLTTFREVGIFHELLAQRLLDDFVEAIEPNWCNITVDFNTRGGIAISASVTYYKEDKDEASDVSQRRA